MGIPLPPMPNEYGMLPLSSFNATLPPPPGILRKKSAYRYLCWLIRRICVSLKSNEPNWIHFYLVRRHHLPRYRKEIKFHLVYRRDLLQSCLAKKMPTSKTLIVIVNMRLKGRSVWRRREKVMRFSLTVFGFLENVILIWNCFFFFLFVGTEKKGIRFADNESSDSDGGEVKKIGRVQSSGHEIDQFMKEVSILAFTKHFINSFSYQGARHAWWRGVSLLLRLFEELEIL